MKKIGYWSIILLTINSIIGAGIFLSPGAVVQIAGGKTPFIYFCAALFAAILAITFASAAKYVSNAGAAYAYAKAAFGDNIGFYVGITRFIAGCIAWGALATGVVKTVLLIFGFDNTNFMLVTFGFMILMLVLLIINILGTKFFEVMNNISTLGKLLALTTVIVAGFFIVFSTGESHFNEINLLKNDDGKPLIAEMNVTTFVTALIAAFYAFSGFESVASGSEDMKEPEKYLPRAIPVAILIIAFIYISVITATMMINPVAIVNAKEIITLVPVFDSPIVKNIILYGTLVSMFGINVAASFHTPRLLEAISKQKQIPEFLTYRTQQDCPIYAFLITIIIAIVLPMAFQYDMKSIIVLSSISRFLQFLLVPIGVILFYFGKQKGSVIARAKKHIVTDVVIPAFAFLLSLLLLIKFDWVGQFTIVEPSGLSHLNVFAIIAMIIGYIGLPLLLYLLQSRKRTV
ncbi:APC family permease [Staphylococcus massiliensis]|uniref:APC family permease n=1 Tax=Staphylococcus massiliensis TaxID=555791 RepID=UPI001EE021E1|nr:APC family permease [Staphylococcus massiliensis]MCG3398774.1 APC family permease [Staphylococcus massiliensis]